jgi:DNA-binding NtrC family response regulator
MSDEIKVLLVDDEEEFVKTLAERLEMRDQVTEVALNGEEALAKLKEGVPDVMVLDLRMPGMDGIEVLRKAKKAHPKMQVVILTGHGTDKDRLEAEKLGAYEYMEKPADLDELHGTIQRAYRYTQDVMTAAAMAEAGEFESAQKIMAVHKKKKTKKK